MSKLYVKWQLEKTDEQKATDYAERRGWMTEKLQSLSRRGFPDRWYLRRGRHVLIEWKKPGGPPPTEQQQKRHREIREHGGEVYWCSTLEEAKEILK